MMQDANGTPDGGTDMNRPEVVVFDVNETLSDMSPIAERFTDIGAPAHLAKLWFATLLRDGFAWINRTRASCPQHFTMTTTTVASLVELAAQSGCARPAFRRWGRGRGRRR